MGGRDEFYRREKPEGKRKENRAETRKKLNLTAVQSVKE